MNKLLFTMVILSFLGCKIENKKEISQNVIKPITDFNQSKIAEIDSLVQTLIDKDKSAGASLGIQIADFKPVLKTYGFSNISTKKKVEVIDQFRIASITKSFTGTAIFQLVNTGKLSLDDTIDKFFKDFPKGNQITIYQLLSHTSGIKNWYEVKMPDDTPSDFPMCEEPQKYIKRMEEMFLFEPGELYYYSNTGYVLLGEIIEVLSGRDYETYLKEEIFMPSGMTDSEMEIKSNFSEQWVKGYGYNQNQSIPFVEPEQYAMPFSAGGLRSTPADLLKFMNMLNSGKLIPEEFVRLMTSYAIINGKGEVIEDNFYFPPDFERPNPPKWLQKYGYGLGFQRMDIYNSAAVWHAGGIAGFQTVLIHIPKNNTTLVLLTNTDGSGGYSSIWGEIQRILTEMKKE